MDMCHRVTGMDQLSIERGESTVGDGAVVFQQGSAVTLADWGRLLHVDKCVQTVELSGGQMIDQHSCTVFYGAYPGLQYSAGRTSAEWVTWVMSKKGRGECVERKGVDKVILGLNDHGEEPAEGEDGMRWRAIVHLTGDAQWREALTTDLEEERKHDLLSQSCTQPSPLAASVRPVLTGQRSVVFINHGPGTNGAHWDAVGGCSMLLDGFKLLVSWDVRRDGDASRHWRGGFLDLEALIGDPSRWWALLGPNCTVQLPADQAHFFITFTHAVLATWARTYYPARVLATLCTLFDDNMDGEGDDTWFTDHGKSPASVVCIIIEVLHASAVRIRAWQAAGAVQRVRRLVHEWTQCWRRRLHSELFGIVACCRRQRKGSKQQQHGTKVERWVDLMAQLTLDPSSNGECVGDFLAAMTSTTRLQSRADD